MPDELRTPRKDDKHPINLAWLRQPAPDEYRLGPDDILGVWVGGILGSTEMGPPVRGTGQRDEVPFTGTPIHVRDDGTIRLPLIDDVPVEGMTVDQAEEEVRKAYLQSGVLAPGLERVLVSLIRPRMHNIIVIRQEQGVANPPRQFGRFSPQQTNRLKRGTGYTVDLPAYRNDVLTALAETGGLPGLDAYNQIVIFRGAFHGEEDRQIVLKQLEEQDPSELVLPDDRVKTSVTTIPLRVAPGEPLTWTPQDIILQTGDVVYIEARDPDVFYTGGLLPTGEWPLPRDYDLDIIEAIALTQGPLYSGGLQTNNFLLAQQLLAGEIGGPSPSLAIVMRKTADEGQVGIRVDLNRALNDPSERILIHPGDFIVLQQTPGEALARYFTGVLRLDLVWRVFASDEAGAVANLRLPDKLPLGFGPLPGL